MSASFQTFLRRRGPLILAVISLAAITAIFARFYTNQTTRINRRALFYDVSNTRMSTHFSWMDGNGNNISIKKKKKTKYL
jgi:hypothetical protein